MRYPQDLSFNYFQPTRVVFGVGAVKEAGLELKRLGVERACIVTDRVLREKTDTVEQVEKDVFIRFFHRPLSRYLNAARAAGFVLEEMVEPAPPDGFLRRAPEYTDAATIPRLLALRFTRT